METRNAHVIFSIRNVRVSATPLIYIRVSVERGQTMYCHGHTAIYGHLERLEFTGRDR